MFGSTLTLSSIPSIIEVTSAHENAVVEPSLDEKIITVAQEKGILPSYLYNLAESESSLGLNRIGDNGDSCGVIHFDKVYYPVENSHCDDDWYILRAAADMIKSGEGWKFTPGSCVSYVRTFLPQVPHVDAKWFKPNTTIAVGRLVIFNYNGVWHVAYITALNAETFTVKEANYIPYKLDTREVDYNDPHIVGFWAPDVTPSEVVLRGG